MQLLLVWEFSSFSLNSMGIFTLLTCPFYNCSQKYLDSQILKRHITKAHSIGNTKFLFEEEQIVSKEKKFDDVKQEQGGEVKKEVLVCPYEECGKYYTNAISLDQHDKSNHLNEKLDSPPNRHEKQEPENNCKSLEKVELVEKNEKAKKITSSDPKYRKMCPICGKTYATKNKLEIHISRHSNERNFICEKCSNTFKNHADLLSHDLSSHGELIPCNECGKPFTAPFLRRHIAKIHVGIKNNICNTCGKAFYSKQRLYKHEIAVHLKVKMFKCDTCDFRCSTDSNLWIHRKKVHKLKVNMKHNITYRAIIEASKMLSEASKNLMEKTSMDTQSTDQRLAHDEMMPIEEKGKEEHK